jgi:hypothetical protein
VSNGGTDSVTCSKYTGETYSTFTKSMSNCYHYFHYVRAFGWNNGSITGSYSEQATCGPVWFHSEVVKTTG